MRPPLTHDILRRRFIFFPLFMRYTFLSLSASYPVSLSFSFTLVENACPHIRQRDIISPGLLPHRRTTDNFAKLRAGCLIARHSGSANSRCTRLCVFLPSLNICLTRFYIGFVRSPFRIPINFAGRPSEFPLRSRIRNRVAFLSLFCKSLAA